MNKYIEQLTDMTKESNVQQYLMSEGSYPNNEQWTCWSTPDEIQTVAEIYNSVICGVRQNESDEWQWNFYQKHQ